MRGLGGSNVIEVPLAGKWARIRVTPSCIYSSIHPLCAIGASPPKYCFRFCLASEVQKCRGHHLEWSFILTGLSRCLDRVAKCLAASCLLPIILWCLSTLSLTVNRTLSARRNSIGWCRGIGILELGDMYFFMRINQSGMPAFHLSEEQREWLFFFQISILVSTYLYVYVFNQHPSRALTCSIWWKPAK